MSLLNVTIRGFTKAFLFVFILLSPFSTNGLAAPAYIQYTDAADFNNNQLPNANEWPAVIDVDITTSVSNGALTLFRGPTSESEWDTVAELGPKARVNVNVDGLSETSVRWRFRFEPGASHTIIYLRLEGNATQRRVELQCELFETTNPFVCNFGLEETNNTGLQRTGDFTIINGSGQPLVVGTTYDVEIRFKAGRTAALIINNQTHAELTFDATKWNNMNWARPEFKVLPFNGQTTNINITLDEMSYSNATDNAAPSVTLGGSPQDTWLTTTGNVTISAVDDANPNDGSGLKCLKAQWDSAPASDSGCYATTVANMPINQQGTRTLYVRAWDWAGNSTVEQATYQLDTTNPTLSGTADSGCGATNNTWQNSCADANFTWNDATDSSSNIISYLVYWGTSSSGTPTIAASTAAYNPSTIPSGSIYYLRVIAIDEAGNQSTATTLFTFKYDNTPPSTPSGLTTGCSGSVISNVWQKSCADPAFNWNDSTDAGSGVARYAVTWGGNPVSRTTSDYNPAAVGSETTTTLQVTAIDNAGNSSAATTFVFKYDGTAPSVPTMGSEDAYTSGSTNTVSWSSVTDSGVGGVQYTVRRASNVACTAGSVDNTLGGTSQEFTGLTSGVTYYYCVQSRDSLGNVSVWSSSVSSTQDASPPTIPVLAAEPDFTSGTTNGISWGAVSDNGVGNVQYQARYANNGSFSEATISGWQNDTTFTASSLTNCVEYFYQVRAKDSFDNISSWSGVESSTQDASPPSGTIEINDGNTWTTVGQVSVDIAASDDCATSGQIQMRLQNEDGTWSAWGPFEATKNWNLTAGDGAKTITIQFRDGANQVSTGTIQDSITVDATKPVVPKPTVSNIIFSPNGDGSLDNSIISATIVEANSVDWTIEIQNAGGTVIRSRNGSGTAVNWTWDGKDNGGTTVADGSGYSVRIQATDAAGNTETSASTALQIDTVPPILSLTHPVDQGSWPANETIPTNQNMLLVEGNVGTPSDTVTVNTQASAVSGATNAFAQNATLTQGANVVTVVVTDLAGNQTTATRNVIFDESAPTLSNVTPTAPTQNNAPLISGTFENAGVSDGSGVAVDLNEVRILRPGGIDVTAFSTLTVAGFLYDPDPPLLEGLNKVRVEMKDEAGNFGAYEWSFEVDRSTSVQIQQPQTGSVLNNVNQTVSGLGEPDANLTLTVNGTPSGNTTVDTNGNFVFPAQTLADNATTDLVISAVDGLGNTAITTSTVMVNSSQPAASVNVAPNPFSDETHFGLFASAPVSASVGSWSLIVGAEVITGNIGLPPASWTWDGVTLSGPLPDGAYGVTLIVTATNNASTTATIATAPDLIRDIAPPDAPAILFPLDGATSIEPSTLVTGTAEPNAAVTIFNQDISGRGLFTFTTDADDRGLWQIVYPLAGGINTLTATATDQAGHESDPSRPATVQVVVEPPLIDVGLFPGMAGPNTAVNLEALSRGTGHPDGPPTASVNVTLPDGSNESLSETSSGIEGIWTGQWIVDPGLAFGPYVLTFEGTDTVGLVGQGKSSLFVDPVPPNPPFLHHPVGDILVNLTQIPMVGQADPLDTIVVSINDTLIPTLTVQTDAQGNWALIVPLIEGLNTIQVNARDLVGNNSISGPVARITRDTLPPQVSGRAVETPIQTGPDLYFRANITDTSDIGLATVQVAGGEVTNGGFKDDPLPLINFGEFWERVRLGDLAEGIYSLVFVAQDEATNTNTTTNTLTIDNTAPLVNRSSALQDTTNARIISDTVWFGPEPNQLTVTVAATDTLAGLVSLDMGNTNPASVGPDFGYAGQATASESHAYPIDPADPLGTTIAITATDLADNVGYAPPIQLLRDIVTPTIPLFYLATDATFTLLDGNTTLVYGPQAIGSLTLTLQTRDIGIGLGQIDFPSIGFDGNDGSQQVGNGVTDLTEFSHVYTIDGSQIVSGTFPVTVTDWVNNSNVVTFTIIRDEAPPELSGEAVRPFIQSGNDLIFDAWITDTYPIAEATVAIDGTSVHDLLDIGNNWTATQPGDLPEAAYDLTFGATDRLGNTATATNTLIVADTDPTVGLSVVTTGPYGLVDEDTVYYGDGDGTYTVTAQVSTPLAGLDTVTFGDATSAGILLPQSGVPSVTLSHAYTFAASSNYSNTLTVTATDRAANTTVSGIAVIRDVEAPKVQITAQSSGLDISLFWSANDRHSGLDSCRLTVDADGVLTELSIDCTGSITYPGLQDVDHVFTLTVFDKVLNQGNASASAMPNSVTKYYYMGADRVAMRNGDGVFYLHGDHLGSTSLVTDENGGAASEKRYYPYGEERFGEGVNLTDFTFTGQRHEAGFGLADYNARFYSPRLGKFISPDTIIPGPTHSQDWNRYAYVRNSPLIYSDPTGHILESPWDVANVGIGVASLGYNLWHGNWGSAAVDAGGLVVDIGATLLPGIPGGAATVVKAGRVADQAVDAVRTVSHVADVNTGAKSAWFAYRLRQVGLHSDEGIGIVNKLSTDFTKGVGDRVVLGRWRGGVGDYIEEATTNGGIFFSTPSDFFPALGKGGVTDDVSDKLAWAVNEQFLRNQLENGIGRIDIVGNSIAEILDTAPASFTAKEIYFLQDVAADYGYTQVGNSWIKSQ